MPAPRRFSLLSFVVLAVVLRLSVSAALVVNAPITLTHRVVVQPILVRKVSGATGPGMGDGTSEAYMKEQINRVWAQVGLRIDWLPFADYVNDFAYDGSPGNYETTVRPATHLNTIVANASSPPKSADTRVVNLFFVEICPSFAHLNDNTANGFAYVDGNGVAVHIGRNLVGSAGARDVAASVIAHEIGHNLGLDHVAQTDNLMASGRTENRLTAAQRAIVFTNNNGNDGYELLQPLGSNYSQWAAAGSVTGGPAGDDDGDEISNVIEFMLNSNPKAFSALPETTGSAGGMTWTLPKRPEAVADGLVYAVRTGTNLTDWLPAGTAGSGSTVLQDSATTLSVRIDAERGFMRLEVAIPAGL